MSKIFLWVVVTLLTLPGVVYAQFPNQAGMVIRPFTHDNCSLTDQKITRLSSFMQEISQLVEKCYYQQANGSVINELKEKMNEDSLFCVNEADPDSMLNHILKKEFDNLRKITNKIKAGSKVALSLSRFLEAKLQILQMQSLLLQGKTYFLITNAGKGMIQEINRNIDKIRDTVAYISSQLKIAIDSLGTFRESYINILHDARNTFIMTEPVIARISNIDSSLLIMRNKVDSLNSRTQQYTTTIEKTSYLQQFNIIRQQQQSDSVALQKINNNMLVLEKKQQSNKLLIILSSILVIASIFIVR